MADYKKRAEKLSMEEQVTRILMENPASRNSDRVLYKLFITRYYPHMVNVPFSVFMDNYSMPSYDSISRARRKAQSRNEHLKPSPEVAEHRANRETEYIDYAVNS